MPEVKLALLNKQGADILDADLPKLNTDIIFPLPENAPTCPQIIGKAANAGTLDSFLTEYKLVDSGTDANKRPNDMKKNIQNFLTNLNNLSADKVQDVSSKNSYSTINSYLTQVEKVIPVIQYADACIAESTVPDTSSLEKQKLVTAESKDRLESIQVPERKVSYYEGWFPLFRPMTEPALFGLFGAGALFLLLAMGICFRLTGVEFKITLPDTILLAGAGGSTDYVKFASIGAGLGLAGAIAYYGYRKGWFGKKE